MNENRYIYIEREIYLYTYMYIMCVYIYIYIDIYCGESIQGRSFVNPGFIHFWKPRFQFNETGKQMNYENCPDS